MTLQNPNKDLVNDNVYTKFGWILFIHSKYMKQKTKFLRRSRYNTDVDLVNDNVYTKFGLILALRSQDIV